MRIPLFIIPALLGLAGCMTYPDARDPYRIVDGAHSGGNALAIDPESRIGASGGWSGRLRLWRLEDGSPLGGWQTGHGDLYGILFLANGRLLTTGYDGHVRVWDLDGSVVQGFKAGAAVTSFQASRDRGHVLLGHDDGNVTLWRVDGEKIGDWSLSGRRITAVAMAEDLESLAAADSAGKVWRWEPGATPVRLESPPSYPRSLLFRRGTDSLLGSGWYNLFAWQSGDTGVAVLPTDHWGIINHMEPSPDGAYLATISRINDSAVLLLDPNSGETVTAFRKHDLCGQRVALSPDGRFMMSNSDDASVRFYRLPRQETAGDAVATGSP